MRLVTIEPNRPEFYRPEYRRELCRALEHGSILLLNHTPYLPTETDREFLHLLPRQQTPITHQPRQNRTVGLDNTASLEQATRLHAIMARYSERALACLADLLPTYGRHWKPEDASFCPVEPFTQPARRSEYSRRNGLMHVDAFPDRPTHGGRILRAFTNIHPDRVRVWALAEPFEELAARYARPAGLARVTGPLAAAQRAMRRAGDAVGLHLPDRSPYDEFMLRFHRYLKANRAFQKRWDWPEVFAFAPGATWIAFTDQVPHRAAPGHLELEQTVIVPRTALIEPHCSPLVTLERLAGKRLVDWEPIQHIPESALCTNAAETFTEPATISPR